MSKVAALFVRENGPYCGIQNVEAWGESRDARKYSGPYPIVAHPPCQRWGKMYAGSPSVIARTGKRHRLGDDGGCFEAAISAARTFGGVVEHPWGSKAWHHFGIDIPDRTGGWIASNDGYDGWTCCVEQGQYGHYARKPTLLVVYGATVLPELSWGKTEWTPSPEQVSRYGEAKARRIGELSFRGGGRDSPVRIDTPDQFKQLLILIAAQCRDRRRSTA